MCIVTGNTITLPTLGAGSIAHKTNTECEIIENWEMQYIYCYCKQCSPCRNGVNHSLLSLIEGLCRLYLGHNCLGELLLSVFHALLCKPLLLLAMVEDGRHVLSGGTASWVVVLPEHLEHCTVVSLLGIKYYLHRLCVITTEREMIAETEVGKSDTFLFTILHHSQTVVGRPLLFPSSEPHASLENPRGAAELRLGEPKSAEGEGGDFLVTAI